jgi:hypothetical protein
VVEIDYDRGEVVLHDPETYNYEGHGRVVPAEISSRQPYVQARVSAPGGRVYDARLHVDSGAGIDLSLFPTTIPTSSRRQKAAPKNGCFVGGLASYRTGKFRGYRLGRRAGRGRTPADYALGEEVIDFRPARPHRLALPAPPQRGVRLLARANDPRAARQGDRCLRRGGGSPILENPARPSRDSPCQEQTFA